MKKKMLAIVAGVFLGATGASASTISVLGTSTTVTCVPACQGFLEDGSLSPVSAFAFTGTPGSEAAIEAQFADILGIDVSLVTATKTGDNDPPLTFGVDAQYFWIKQATWRAYFTTSGSTQVTVFDDVSNYGEIDVIPLPAAGWLLLAGVGGLAAMRRRKKVA